MMKNGEILSVPDVGNYYGGLSVRKVNDLYEWSIRDWDGDNWSSIPDYLAEALIKFSNEPNND